VEEVDLGELAMAQQARDLGVMVIIILKAVREVLVRVRLQLLLVELVFWEKLVVIVIRVEQVLLETMV
jgi:hypothetical protein